MDAATKETIVYSIIAAVAAVVLFLNLRYVLKLRRQNSSLTQMIIAGGPLLLLGVMSIGLVLSVLLNNLGPLLICLGIGGLFYNIIALKNPDDTLAVATGWGWLFSAGYQDSSAVYIYGVGRVVAFIILTLGGFWFLTQ